MKVWFTVGYVAVLASPSSAFIFGVTKLIQNPSLAKFADAQTGTKLEIQLDVGTKPEESRLSVNGLNLELLQAGADDPSHPKLPGIDGPHPSLSSGARTLSVHQAGSFVSMKGTQEVPLEHGCWEIIWKEDNPAGMLVVGFDLASDIQRNTAKLPKGRVYMSFPVWTPEGLAEAQVEKFRIEGKASEYTKERLDSFQKYAEEPNLLKKAMHYRDAAAAMEKHQVLNTKLAESIPLDKDVMSIPPGLLVCNKGTIWSKQGSFQGGHHTLLGAAILRSTDHDDGLLKP